MKRKIINPIYFFHIKDNRPDEEYCTCTYPGVRNNAYLISNYGEVISKSRWVPLHQEPSHHGGHMRVSLCTTEERSPNRFQKGMKFFDHRLVANEFLDPPDNPEKNCINHINGDHLFNYYKNLEWVTDAENREHAVKHDLYRFGENSPTAIITNEQANEICKCIEKGMSNSEIAKLELVPDKTDQQIRDIARNIRQKNTWTRVSKKYNF